MNCHSCDVLIKPRKIPLDVTKLRAISKNCKDCVKTCMEYKKKGKVPATCRDYVSNNKMLIKILEKMAEKPIKVKKNIKNTFPKDLETKDVSFRHNKRTLNPRLTPTRSASHYPTGRPITVVPRVIPSPYQGPRGPLGPSGSNGTRRPPTTQIVHPDYEALGFNTSRPRGVHPDYEALGVNTSRPPTNQGPRRGAPFSPPTNQGPRRGAPPAYEALGFNTSRPPTNQGPRRGAPSGFEGLGFNTSRPRGIPAGYEEIMRRFNAA
jgi:hypothetical protein